MKNFEQIKQQTKAIVEPILNKYDLTIYEINNFNDFEGDVIQILIEDRNKPNVALDFERIMLVNGAISEAMDQVLTDDNQYLLEVASAGIEKQIKTKDKIIQALEQYLHIELNNNQVYEGVLQQFDQKSDLFLLAYFIKGQKKKVQFKWEEIKFVRFAIKF